MINEKALQKMVDQVHDQKVKEYLSKKIHNKISKQIYCLSSVCKGRMIGYVDNKGVPEADELRDKEGILISGLLAIRERLDGNLGVQCACRRDSRLAKAEKKIISDVPPSKEDLNRVYENLTKYPTKIVDKGDKIQIDGFLIESYKENI